MRHLRLLAVALGLVLLSPFGAGAMAAAPVSPLRLSPPARTVDKELFSLNLIGLQYGIAWPTVPFASWRNFHSYWDVLEPRKGEWNFAMLDGEIDMAVRTGTEVLLVLGSTPTWASARPNEPGCCTQDAPRGNAAEARDLADWRHYVRTVASRYKGRVRHYELWNEPNVSRFYSGSVEKLVELNREAYRVLKEVDPSIVVVSSSLSRCCDAVAYLEKYLAGGGGKWADVIGFHFYPAPQPPEAMLPLIRQVRELMGRHGVHKPLWNTETGWRVRNRDRNTEGESWAGPALSDAESVSYLARTYLLSWAAGVERLYWYAWGHNSMGMTDYDGRTPKPIAAAFAELQGWLGGAEMRSCEQGPDGTWIAAFSRSGKPFWIVWNPEKKVGFTPPAGWRIAGWRGLAGDRGGVGERQEVAVGPAPVRLEPVP